MEYKEEIIIFLGYKSNLSWTVVSCILNTGWASEKVASDLGLGSVFQFPPLHTAGAFMI